MDGTGGEEMTKAYDCLYLLAGLDLNEYESVMWSTDYVLKTLPCVEELGKRKHSAEVP